MQSQSSQITMSEDLLFWLAAQIMEYIYIYLYYFNFVSYKHKFKKILLKSLKGHTSKNQV